MQFQANPMFLEFFHIQYIPLLNGESLPEINVNLSIELSTSYKNLVEWKLGLVKQSFNRRKKQKLPAKG